MISAALAMLFLAGGGQVGGSAQVPPPVVAPDDAQGKREAAHDADVKADRENGKKYSEQAEKELKLSKDAAALERVNRIGKVLAAIANKTPAITLWGDKRMSQFDYTFKVVDDKDPNAFSLPGGYIYVNTGLLTYVQSDDELAGVLAHEIAHAEMRHVATLQHEQEKMLTTVQLPLVILSLLLGGAGAAPGALGTSQLIGAAGSSGWSVKAELAADYGGFQYMTQSPWNPTGMLTLMERLAQDERSKLLGIDLGIARTHPPSRERAEALVKYMRAADIPIQRSKVSTTFRATDRAMPDGTVQVDFGARKIVAFCGAEGKLRADEATENLNAFFDSTPELYDLSDGPNGAIYGRRQLLFAVTSEDADKQKSTVKALQLQAMSNLRTAIFNVAYRVWDTR